ISLSSLKKYFISFPATFPIPQLHLQVEFRKENLIINPNLVATAIKFSIKQVQNEKNFTQTDGKVRKPVIGVVVWGAFGICPAILECEWSRG
ncbi:MAG: hypothetical protein SNI36_08280, partial [Rikenellaceae bacterium]